ncbi:MAG: zinc-ribbon domain-containing protein [Candidatus Bathyarchaeia archaeon]
MGKNITVTSSTCYLTQPTGQAKSCPYCGATNSADTVYCLRCGKKL